MIYIYLSYNRAIHTSTGKSPFETFFGYFSPSALDYAYELQLGVMEDMTGESVKTEKFVEKIRQVHFQV